MVILAEISDKMPSAVGVLLVWAAASAICAGIASINRALAWPMLLLTSIIGCPLAYIAFDDAFISGPMRDAVWSELGWSWVLSDIGGPVLPVAAVVGILLVRRSYSERRGFPLEGRILRQPHHD